MLASEAHGTPFGKFAFGAVCCVPVEVSITVPCIATAAPAAVEVRGACIDVSLGPLPTP